MRRGVPRTVEWLNLVAGAADGQSVVAAAISVADALALVALGTILGVLGQLLRFLVELADPENAPFQRMHFLVSVLTAVVVGAAAGILGAVSFVGGRLDAVDVLALIAIGYVGTDVVEQFLKRAFPELTGSAPFVWTVTDREPDPSSAWDSSSRR